MNPDELLQAGRLLEAVAKMQKWPSLADTFPVMQNANGRRPRIHELRIFKRFDRVHIFLYTGMYRS